MTWFISLHLYNSQENYAQKTVLKVVGLHACTRRYATGLASPDAGLPVRRVNLQITGMKVLFWMEKSDVLAADPNRAALLHGWGWATASSAPRCRCCSGVSESRAWPSAPPHQCYLLCRWLRASSSVSFWICSFFSLSGINKELISNRLPWMTKTLLVFLHKCGWLPFPKFSMASGGWNEVCWEL